MYEMIFYESYLEESGKLPEGRRGSEMVCVETDSVTFYNYVPNTYRSSCRNEIPL